MVAEEQVCVIFAGVRGYPDKMVTSKISKFEAKLLVSIRCTDCGFVGKIKKEGKLDGTNEWELNVLIGECDDVCVEIF